MSINYSVQATIVDIRSDTPLPTDTFLVDSNVWYWLFYNPNPTPNYYQVTDYIAYITQARLAKSLLAYSGFSLAELAHIIEKEEREIFNSSRSSPIRTKEYRHNYSRERVNVFTQVQTVWSQVKAIAVPVELTIDERTTDAALNRFGTDLLDGYDLFILETMKKEGIKNIITDDGDFATVSGITVFTANNNVIKTAQRQGKLIAR
ncbi:MAG: PIN domain-containing protein [Crocosphaera sp.]|nr:PIN domain-containing protein [Crocosphaera sp.]